VCQEVGSRGENSVEKDIVSAAIGFSKSETHIIQANIITPAILTILPDDLRMFQSAIASG